MEDVTVDKRGLEMLLKVNAQLAGRRGVFGIVRGGKYYKGRAQHVEIAKVAGILEARLGVFTVAFDRNDAIWRSTWEHAALRIVSGENIDTVLREVLLTASSVVRQNIIEFGLVKTGQLIDEIRWEISGGGGKKLAGKAPK